MDRENQAMNKLASLLKEIMEKRNSMREFPDNSSIVSFKVDDQKRIIIGLKTSGCSWARHSGGGCTHCGIAMKKEMVDINQMYEQFLSEFSKVDFDKYPTLCLYTPGSFLDQKEIPQNLRNNLLNAVSEKHRIKKLIIESRPEFISKEVASEVRKILPDLDIEVGIGLDTINDKVRSLCLNKGFDLQSYKTACNILKDYDFRILSYIVIKPPFLSEKESIDDAIESAKKAFELGSSIVSLEPLSVQKFTIVENLYKIGMYRPPWLWSVIEIAKEVSKYGNTRIGQFSYPSPVLVPENCKKCTTLVSEKIKEFNNTGNIKVFKNLDCDCRRGWKRDLGKKSNLDLSSRVPCGIWLIEKSFNDEFCHISKNRRTLVD